jgi:hypothetical protein
MGSTGSWHLTPKPGGSQAGHLFSWVIASFLGMAILIGWAFLLKNHRLYGLGLGE